MQTNRCNILTASVASLSTVGVAARFAHKANARAAQIKFGTIAKQSPESVSWNSAADNFDRSFFSTAMQVNNMHVINFSAEDLGLERPKCLQAAYAVLELLEGEPVRGRSVGEVMGRTRKQVRENLATARRHGLLEMHGRGVGTGYLPTDKLRKIKDEEDKRQRSEVAGGMGCESGGATGAA
jgi:hypothetical protein